MANLADIQLQTLEGKSVNAAKHFSASQQLILFLSPECPLCRKYIAEMRRIQDDFDAQLNFLAVFSGEWYAQSKIQQFLDDNQLAYEVLLDPDYQLSSYLGASVTPEAFLLDQAGQVLYSGAIDNWAFEVGKTRPAPTKFYLRDALEASFNGEKISTPKTTAVGCLIE